MTNNMDCDIVTSYKVLVEGFEHATSTAEVHAHFAHLVAVSQCSLLTPHPPIYELTLNTRDDIVSLVKKTDHVYEDRHLSLQVRVIDTDMALAKTIECQTEASSETVKQAFEKFALVQGVKQVHGQTYIRFKKNVAEQALASIVHAGGVFVEDEELAVRGLTRIEEGILAECVSVEVPVKASTAKNILKGMGKKKGGVSKKSIEKGKAFKSTDKGLTKGTAKKTKLGKNAAKAALGDMMAALAGL
jgi:hypothetical protein